MSLQEEVTTENDISEVPVVTTTTSSAPYDRKQHSKAIRVLTVIAYVLSVSLAAILLSIYYIFVWDGHPTLAARLPQAPIDLDSENLQVKVFQEVSRKRDTSMFLNGNDSIESRMTEKDLSEGSVKDGLVENAANNEEAKKCEENEDEEKTEGDTSQNFADYGFLNSSENSTVWMIMNNTVNMDEYRIGLPLPDPTMDYEDSTNYTTAPSDENSTWFSELDDLNADYGVLNKRSVFMKKLLGHHNAMPK